MCMLMGTDFNAGIKGIGPKKALKYIRENGDLEHVLARIGEDIPDRDEIRDIFLNYKGADGYDTQYTEPDRQGVIDMLAGYDFSEDRVAAALDRIDKARAEQKKKRQQRSLDAFF